MIASLGAVGLGNFSSATQPAELIDENLTPEPSPDIMTFQGPAPVVDGTKPYVATIKTNQGDIKIKLVTDAPQAVNSFAFLAGKGFYDGQVFFYVNPDLGAVAGDPTCTDAAERACSGVGGPGYTLPLENTAEKHDAWAVVIPYLTEGGQEVHGSQFRILFKPDPRLDGKETVLGSVVEGRDILEKLPACSLINGGQCDPKLVIEDVLIEPA